MEAEVNLRVSNRCKRSSMQQGSGDNTSYLMQETMATNSN